MGIKQVEGAILSTQVFPQNAGIASYKVYLGKPINLTQSARNFPLISQTFLLTKRINKFFIEPMMYVMFNIERKRKDYVNNI